MACRVRIWLRVCQGSVDVFLSEPKLPFSNCHITDAITLNALRALQGIGGAAIVPAAVRLFQFSEGEKLSC